MYRLFGVGVVLLWVSAMGALFMRDVWPAWTAQDAPPMTAEQFARLLDRDQQYGLFAGDGRRIGTAWSHMGRSGINHIIGGTVHLDSFEKVPAVLIESTTEFDTDGELDSFTLDVLGLANIKIKVHGERRGIYFPCELQVGPFHRQANLELSASRLIGDSLRPFDYLPKLAVGQAWRMQMIDPLSAVMGGKTRFTSVVARVTGKETIPHRGADTECYIVETSPTRAKAWVSSEGRVLRQEADVPMLGKVVVQEEDYKARDLRMVKKRFQSSGGSFSGPEDDEETDLPPIHRLKEHVHSILERVRHGGH